MGLGVEVRKHGLLAAIITYILLLEDLDNSLFLDNNKAEKTWNNKSRGNKGIFVFLSSAAAAETLALDPKITTTERASKN